MNTSIYPERDDASTEDYRLTYYAPPKGMEREILTLFDIEFAKDLVDDRHVGALGQLFITTNGSGTAEFDGRTDSLSGARLFCGFDKAVPCHLAGPYRCLGASLSPFGWASLTRVPANKLLNRVIPASDLLGKSVERLADEITEQCTRSDVSPEQSCYDIAEWIRDRLTPIPSHHEALIAKTMAWLGSSLYPSVEELFEVQYFSRRQVERLVLRYFGFTPRALARKYRAIRAANLLATPDLTAEEESNIASAFYDQPHMVREIRRYCGYTPSRLGGEGQPMFQQLLRMKNLDRHQDFRKPNR